MTYHNASRTGHRWTGARFPHDAQTPADDDFGVQIYDHVSRGWMALSLFDLGMSVVCVGLVVCIFGERPVMKSVVDRFRARRRAAVEPDSEDTNVDGVSGSAA